MGQIILGPIAQSHLCNCKANKSKSDMQVSTLKMLLMLFKKIRWNSDGGKNVTSYIRFTQLFEG